MLNSFDLLQPLFSNHDDSDYAALKEAEIYLHDSFGNSTRIDYGTGHEMAFVMFLACLFHSQVLHINQDVAATGLLVFSKYMDLVRKLQLTYRMEPAGSQGVSCIKKPSFARSLPSIFHRCGLWTIFNLSASFGVQLSS